MERRSYPPLTVWNDDDHSGPIVITTTLAMFFWLLPGLLQFSVSLAHERRVKSANAFLALSLASGVVQSALVLTACRHGLGRSARALLPQALHLAQRFYYASNIIFILTLGFIKASAALDVANLTVKMEMSLRAASTRHKGTLYALLAVAFAWTVGSIISIALPCASNSVCIGTVHRWVGILVCDAIIDIAIALFATDIIWRTNAQVRLVWYIPFCLRPCFVICANLRILAIDQAKLNTDPTIKLWLFIVLSQVEMFLSLICAAVPAMKKNMNSLITNFGAPSDSQAGSRAYGSQGGSFPMKHLQASKDRSKGKFTPFTGGTRGSTMVSSNSRYNHTGDGESEEGIVHTTEFEVRSTHEEDKEDRSNSAEQL